MANVEHVDIASANCHEPKHITISTTADSGKIITADSSVSGTSEFRAIKESDITEGMDILYCEIDDLGTNGSAWVVSNNAGTIEKIYSVIHAAISGSDETITAEIDGTLVTSSNITITQSGSAAGDVASSTPTANNAVTAGQAIEIITAGNSTGAVKASFTIYVKRT